MCTLFCFWLLSFNLIFVRSTHIFMCICRLFTRITEEYSIVWPNHNLFIHSIIHELLSSFQFGTIMKSAAMNILDTKCLCPFYIAVYKTTATNQQWCIISYIDHLSWHLSFLRLNELSLGDGGRTGWVWTALQWTITFLASWVPNALRKVSSGEYHMYIY